MNKLFYYFKSGAFCLLSWCNMIANLNLCFIDTILQAKDGIPWYLKIYLLEYLEIFFLYNLMWEHKHHVPHLFKKGYTCLCGMVLYKTVSEFYRVISKYVTFLLKVISSWSSYNVRGLLLTLEVMSMGTHSLPHPPFSVSQSLTSHRLHNCPSWVFNL